MGRFEDITGQKFGRLTAINYAGDRKWLFKCDCGKEKIIRTNDVKSGRTQSCGCYGREKINEACTTHNMSKTRLYSVYASMKQRCFNEKVAEYKNYGGRGIKICDEWLGKNGFENFYNWAMQNGYDESAKRGECTIDRENNDGNYCPENCRWVTQDVQAGNKRKPELLICGEKHTLKEWSDITGLTVATIRQRIKSGWKDEEIISIPKKDERENKIIHPKSKELTFKGETHTLVEWSKITGISNKILAERLRMGYSEEDVLCNDLMSRRKIRVIVEKITSGETMEFESQKEAANYIGTIPQNVNKCVKGKLKQTNGYKVYIKK